MGQCYFIHTVDSEAYLDEILEKVKWLIIEHDKNGHRIMGTGRAAVPADFMRTLKKHKSGRIILEAHPSEGFTIQPERMGKRLSVLTNRSYGIWFYEADVIWRKEGLKRDLLQMVKLIDKVHDPKHDEVFRKQIRAYKKAARGHK